MMYEERFVDQKIYLQSVGIFFRVEHVPNPK